MKDIIAKLKQSLPPMLLGWILTVWLPVPHVLRRAATTVVDAARNGVTAIVRTVSAPPPAQETAER